MTNIYALLILIGYYLVTGILGIIINTKTKLNDEIKRKLLHSFGFLSYPIFMYAFNDWVFSSITALIIGIGTFIFILLLEKYRPSFLLFMKEREAGEIKYTILYVFLIFSLSIIISWGLLSTSLLGTLAILAWGFGDMGASLVGKLFGKHHYSLPQISNKSIEGTIACFIFTSLTSIIILFVYSFTPVVSILFGLGLGLIGAIVELISINGLDTIFMPSGLLLFSFILFLI